MNAPSYDPRMENLPVLIAYPRSGNHWINNLIELYYNRPKLRDGPKSILQHMGRRTDFMFFSDHDRFAKLILSHRNIMYLYRNPDDVIHSLLIAEHNTISKPLVDQQIAYLREHLYKYLVNGGSRVHIKYEGLQRDIYSEFQKVVRFFDDKDSLDKDKLDSVRKIVTKDNLRRLESDERYFNKQMFSPEYQDSRMDFRERYKKHIVDNLIDDKLSAYFLDWTT